MSDETRWAQRAAELRKPGIPSPARIEPLTAGEMLADIDHSKDDSFSTFNAAKRQQQLRINFRFRSGYELSLPYSYLIAVSFEPTAGIVLEYSGHRVTLVGRGLKKLKRAIDKHMVGSVQEVDEYSDKALADAKATAVYGIKREDPA